MYSGFTFRSNIPYAVQRKLILCAYIHLYLKTRHKLPVYGIRNIRTERKSAVVCGGPGMPGHFSACAISVYQTLFFPLPLKKNRPGNEAKYYYEEILKTHSAAANDGCTK